MNVFSVVFVWKICFRNRKLSHPNGKSGRVVPAQKILDGISAAIINNTLSEPIKVGVEIQHPQPIDAESFYNEYNREARDAVVEQNGEAQIQQLSKDASQAVGDVAKTGQEGTINEVTAVEAEASAQAAGSNVVSGATIAPKLYRIANDQQQAGNTRLSGIQGNINQLAQGIGNLSNSKSIVRDFKYSIGNSLGNYGKAIGAWDTSIQPVIQSIGSIAVVGTALEDLDNAVETDLTTLNANPVQNNEEENEEKDNTSDDKSNNNLEFETPKVKLSGFGI